MTANAYDVRFDASGKVDPHPLADMKTQADQFNVFMTLLNSINQHFEVKSTGVSFIQVTFGFQARVHTAYENWHHNYRGLPTHDEYLKFVDTFNRFVDEGNIVQISVPNPPAAPAAAALPTLGAAATLDQVVLAVNGLTSEFAEFRTQANRPGRAKRVADWLTKKPAHR